MMSISPVNFFQAAGRDPSAPHSVAETQKSFAETLGNALDTVNRSQQTANQKVTELAGGNSSEDLHNVMIATQEANVLLRTTVQVRDRVIEAYQEIMRMQV